MHNGSSHGDSIDKIKPINHIDDLIKLIKEIKASSQPNPIRMIADLLINNNLFEHSRDNILIQTKGDLVKLLKAISDRDDLQDIVIEKFKDHTNKGDIIITIDDFSTVFSCFNNNQCKRQLFSHCLEKNLFSGNDGIIKSAGDFRSVIYQLKKSNMFDEIKAFFLHCKNNGIFYGENSIVKSAVSFSNVMDELNKEQSLDFFSYCKDKNIFFGENGIIKTVNNFSQCTFVLNDFSNQFQVEFFSYCKEQDAFFGEKGIIKSESDLSFMLFNLGKNLKTEKIALFLSYFDCFISNQDTEIKMESFKRNLLSCFDKKEDQIKVLTKMRDDDKLFGQNGLIQNQTDFDQVVQLIGKEEVARLLPKLPKNPEILFCNSNSGNSNLENRISFN